MAFGTLFGSPGMLVEGTSTLLGTPEAAFWCVTAYAIQTILVETTGQLLTRYGSPTSCRARPISRYRCSYWSYFLLARTSETAFDGLQQTRAPCFWVGRGLRALQDWARAPTCQRVILVAKAYIRHLRIADAASKKC